jgi:hypothetical protein
LCCPRENGIHILSMCFIPFHPSETSQLTIEEGGRTSLYDSPIDVHDFADRRYIATFVSHGLQRSLQLPFCQCIKRGEVECGNDGREGAVVVPSTMEEEENRHRNLGTET